MSRCFSAARAADQVHRRLHALAQVEGVALDVHAPGLDLGEVEDVVDDRQQRIAGVADGGGEVALVVGQRRVQQQPAHADHRVHRRADLVAHRRQEGALGFVGGFGLGAGLLRLLEHLRVLDRDHRLVGEGLEQRDLLVGEGLASAMRATSKAPMPWPFQISGTYSSEMLPIQLGRLAHRGRHARSVLHVREVQHGALVGAVAMHRLACQAPGSWRAATATTFGYIGSPANCAARFTSMCTRPSSPIRPRLT